MTDYLAQHPLWQQTMTTQAELSQRFLQTLQQETERLYEDFEAGVSTESLIKRRSLLIDALLSRSLHFFTRADTGISLIAVGGYGRQELLPYSDIDILILCTPDNLKQQQTALEQFITFLWDSKLRIGHSVRTLSDCIKHAVADITIITNLTEARFITGDSALYEQLMSITAPNKIWPSKAFFQAKREEQIERHKKYGNTQYRLEPNIKQSQGGLRDIQMIGWIAKRHFAVDNIDALLTHGFLTQEEYDLIIQGQSFLLKIRFALHMLNRREEDRLLFDQQVKIAHYFGYQDNKTLAVEQLMKDYYRWAQALSQMNDLIMQLFDENILRACEAEEVLELNPRFRVRNRRIEAANNKIFKEYPYAIMEIFVLMARHDNIIGVRGATIRQLRESHHLINDSFRNDAMTKRLFIELLQSHDYVASQLSLMSRYGILGNYIPAFGKIIGQMQHDLFHIYTVDSHTLQVLKNARQLAYGARQDVPIASQVAQQLDKKDLLYLACLFHDIGKGRGGNHSILGARDALEFCLYLGYSQRDSNLVSWLVRQHLLMSYTAQKKDLADPDVIREFALTMGDIEHLDYLFVLTVADINGTNPDLWNSWRASLLRNLYYETKLALRRGLENVIDKQELIEERQNQARQRLLSVEIAADDIDRIWANAGDDYFLNEKVDEIVWQTKAIAQRFDQESALVLVQHSPNTLFNGATQIFIHTKDQGHIFAAVATVLEQQKLNIVDARIYSSYAGYTLDTFMVLDEQGELLTEPRRLSAIQQALEEQLKNPDQIKSYSPRHTSRQLRFFNVNTQTRLNHDSKNRFSILEVVSADRPGLLATIGRIFVEFGIDLINAKIATLGERVEDIFFIRKDGQALLDKDEGLRLEQTIRQQLDDKVQNDKIL